MESASSEWIKVSARMPRSLINRLARLYPKAGLSELLRNLIEREIVRQKVLKAHMKLYGRFKAKDFNEGLL